MPKNNDSTKSKMRSKSTRKLLREVSNVTTAIKPAPIYNDKQGGDDSLDRLLAVHSDLSSLLRQIDELVDQTRKLTSKKGRMEIKQFADVLSDVQTSLKPWVPRLRKAVSSEIDENKLEKPISNTVCVLEQDTNGLIESPEPTKCESLISPSPLVSWRAECNAEGGRQLFLLTPLQRTKTITSKCQSPSIPPNEKYASDEVALPAAGNFNNNLLKGVSTKQTSEYVLNRDLNKTIFNLENERRASPAKFSRINSSMFAMTPLKMSPLKSCILLEPVSEVPKKRIPVVHRSTPFQARVENSSKPEDSESSSSQNSVDLTLRYPELFGIKAHTLRNKEKVVKELPEWNLSPPKTCAIMEPSEKVVEELPEWNLSPPKTCAIMEPSDEELWTSLYDKSSSPETSLVCNQQANKTLMMKETDNGTIPKSHHQQDCSNTFCIAESTPLVKEPASSFRTGKQHPGENTLKKELWTRFEAATTHGICFKDTGFQKTAQKGFLHQLNEAYDE